MAARSPQRAAKPAKPAKAKSAKSAEHRIRVTQNPDVDAQLTANPFALLSGMLLDQQIPMERAFSGPYVIAERMEGEFDPATVAAYDPEAFATLCAKTPAVHRFPGAMAGRIQALAHQIIESYDGDAAQVWDVPDGPGAAQEILKRLKGLPGFGPAKARIFLALLAKQLGVQPKGWEAAVGDLGDDAYRSVADVVDGDSLLRVRAYKQELKKKKRDAGE